MSVEEAEAAAPALDITSEAEGAEEAGAAGEDTAAVDAAAASGESGAKDAAAAAAEEEAEEEGKEKKKKKKKKKDKERKGEKERKKHRRKREEEEDEEEPEVETEGAEGAESATNGKHKEAKGNADKKEKERFSSRRDRSPSRDRGGRERRRYTRSRSRSRSAGRRTGGGGGSWRPQRSPTPPREKERRHERRRSRSRSRDRRSHRRSRSRSNSRDRHSRRRRRSSRSRSRGRDRDRKRRSRSESSGEGGEREKEAVAEAEPEEVLEPGVVDVAREASIKGPIPTIVELIKKDPSLGVVKALAKVEEEKQARVLNEGVQQQAQALMQANLNGAQQAAAMGAGVNNPMPALTRPARQLFVGNLPPGTLAPQLSAFLAAAMGQMGLLRAGPGNPCTNAWLSPDARFALVEFRSVEEATAALALNNLPLSAGAGAGGGQQLRVGRPKEYYPSYLALKDTPLNSHSIVTAPPPSTPGVVTAAGVPGAPSAVAGGAVVLPPTAAAIMTSPYLMLMNLPTLLGELDVKELIKSFGTPKSFNLLKDKDGTSKGIAIFEYAERSEAQVALKGLQGLEIGGKRLAVQEIPTAQANMLLRPVAPAVTGAEGGVGLSTVVRLRNMLTAEMNAEEVGEIKDEVADECRKYGNLVEVVCGAPEAAGLDIFVEFGDARASQRALRKLHGRSFDGRSVEAAYYPLEAFKAGDYAQEGLGQGEDGGVPGRGMEGQEKEGGEANREGEQEEAAAAAAAAPEGEAAPEEEGAPEEEAEPPAAAAPPGPVVDEDLD